MKFPIRLPVPSKQKRQSPDEVLEKRLVNIVNFYQTLESTIDGIPVPENFRATLKEKLMNDSELKEIIEAIKTNRPPRIFLTGRTGAGKSSLVNALCGSYVADVSDLESCARNANGYEIKDGNRVLMEIFDPRGTGEAEKISERLAEDELIENLEKFCPDVAILVFEAAKRDGSINEDIRFMKAVAESYGRRCGVKLPVIVVLNKCDRIKPDTQNRPEEYSSHKIENIKESENFYRRIIRAEKFDVKTVIAVSSLIDWYDEKGNYLDADDINRLTEEERSRLTIGFDGRYRIDRLFEMLRNSIQDIDAKRGLMMSFQLNVLTERLAERINMTFAGISGAIAATPIPIADIYILLSLQAVLVSLIALLSGIELSLEEAMKFILSLGGVFVAGNVFRMVAHELVKLIPFAGNMISAFIASSGTAAIGKAAIAFYIHKKDMKDAKNTYSDEMREAQKKNNSNDAS